MIVLLCASLDHMMISGLQSHKELFLDDEEMYSDHLQSVSEKSEQYTYLPIHSYHFNAYLQRKSLDWFD